MGVLKTLLGVVILVAIGVIGYWLYATYTIASADDEFWVKVNSNMPAPLRHWSCGQVKARVNTPQAPEGCTALCVHTRLDAPPPAVLTGGYA
jgi:hypothetical protein